MYSYSIVPYLTAKMSILLWITIEMEYIIKCLKFILFFTNGHQKLTTKGLISMSRQNQQIEFSNT